MMESYEEKDILLAVAFEIAGLRHRLAKIPPSREISLAITKLDEARHWLRAHEESLGKPG